MFIFGDISKTEWGIYSSDTLGCQRRRRRWKSACWRRIGEGCFSELSTSIVSILNPLPHLTRVTSKLTQIHCPRLKSLRLGWCKNVTDLSLETIATSRLSVLEMLDLSLTGITDDSIQNLEHALFSIPTLTHLDLSATQLTGTRFLTALARHRNTSELPLRELSFQFMQELTMESLEEFLDSKSFRRLQILDLNFSEVSNPKTTSHDIQGAVTRAMERNRRLHERSSCWGRDT